MIDSYTFEQCKKDKEILKLKLNNLEHAIKQSEEMIAESQLDDASLVFLRRKVAHSIQELEALYFLKQEQEHLQGLESSEFHQLRTSNNPTSDERKW